MFQKNGCIEQYIGKEQGIAIQITVFAKKEDDSTKDNKKFLNTLIYAYNQ